MGDQISLFQAGPVMPEGFQYQAEVITPGEEQAVLEKIKGLAFKEFEFQGFLGKRRVVSFGWKYYFNERELREAAEIPRFLYSLRQVAASFAGINPSGLQHILVTEYSPGAAIGWHRDKAMFGVVVGVSLLSSCIFRLRRKAGKAWERASVAAERRSAYVLQGPSRTEWEHSIPPVNTLRYSVTFRNLLPEGERAY